MATPTIQEHLTKLHLPQPQSHKGQNGKLLIIGGSHLFHAASKWSLDVASKFVDMVFYASVPSNNKLVEQAKGEFWNGIVIERTEIESYLQEADAILIGPGMTRAEFVKKDYDTPPSDAEWDSDTQKITNYLLKKYPNKKWVIDAGALQMVEPVLLTETMILTPHAQELERLQGLVMQSILNKNVTQPTAVIETTQQKPFNQLLATGCTVLVKGPVDYIYQKEQIIEVSGGNPGMTKGGTGDVLAGLVSALYTTNDAMTAAVVGSYANKQAGEFLAEKVGPFFSASDLVVTVPEVLWKNLTSRSYNTY